MRFSREIFQTFTGTIATPAVFTLVEHPFTWGDKVIFETTGALPTGLLVDTEYWIIKDGIGEDDFQISASKDGDAIATSGTQSGVHSLLKVSRASLKPFNESNK